MANDISVFGRIARDLARNPLGIIALFISMIYGFATLLLNSSADKLSQEERFPLVVFIVIFPLFVLLAFYRLVTKHHGKLYAPSDYKYDQSFLYTLSPQEQKNRLEQEVEELTNLPKRPSAISENKQNTSRFEDRETIKNYIRNAENLAISKLEKELGRKAVREVKIAETNISFDAIVADRGKTTIAIEVKFLRAPISGITIIDRLLYQIVIANHYMKGDLKTIIVLVYNFDKEKLSKTKNYWERKIEECPANIELRYYHYNDLKNEENL
ncbi:MAG: hypothetical protein KAQ99_09690 [Candidatus Aureabacteria bacterium]|nr:hypothetical protein [Candidatus Auribacterota bacterium]MCK5161832.1 hypothetical protein [Candidatus Auribacterota bacterium]